MPKFGTANSAKTFSAAKAATEKANVTVVMMIDNANLVDNPANNEDVSYTADLEASIREIGFVDPIDVTAYGQDDGKYMIISGHRRRATGVKLGITSFPCIVHNFQSDADIENWLLLLNSYRDSEKDPLLFMRRCKATEAYLNRIGFDGSIRTEIARRLGLSAQQTDRYLALSKVITPVHELIRKELVGVSSVVPLATHTPEEQAEIYDIMTVASGIGVELTRGLVKKIVDAYRNGCRSWAAVSEFKESKKDESNDLANGLFADAISATTSSAGTTDDEKKHDRNSEVRREFDPIAAEADRMDAAASDVDFDEEVTHGEDSEFGCEDKPVPKSKSEKKEKTDFDRADDVLAALQNINDACNSVYSFRNDMDAKNALRTMQSTICQIVDEMLMIADEHKAQSIKVQLGGLIYEKLVENGFLK